MVVTEMLRTQYMFAWQVVLPKRMWRLCNLTHLYQQNVQKVLSPSCKNDGRHRCAVVTYGKYSECGWSCSFLILNHLRDQQAGQIQCIWECVAVLHMSHVIADPVRGPRACPQELNALEQAGSPSVLTKGQLGSSFGRADWQTEFGNSQTEIYIDQNYSLFIHHDPELQKRMLSVLYSSIGDRSR